MEKVMSSQNLKTLRGYAVGLMRDVAMGEEIAEYLRRIDATLKPYSGHFLIHGFTANEVEGAWPGDLIVIEFPSMEDAFNWYYSDAYLEILPLRTANADGAVALFRGVEHSHRGIDILGENVK